MHYSRLYRHGDASVVKPKGPRVDWSAPARNYKNAHDRLGKLWGKAALYPCVECGESARSWAYDGTDPTQEYGARSGRKHYYSAWPEFYMPMCPRCHGRRDKAECARDLEEYRDWKHRTGLTLKDVECQALSRKNEARGVTASSMHAPVIAS